MNREIICIVIAATCLKVLLIPSYHSTDFEVHRNWMAITGHLPLKEWYFSDLSIWTLDYPPLFAYFEKFLFLISEVIDRNLVQLDSLGDDRVIVVYFQRLSVIVTEALLIWAVICFTRVSNCVNRYSVIAIVACNVGIILVDHMHFQYNGLLLGILVFVVTFIFQEKYLLAAISFSVLVWMKHLFAPLALPVGVYLLVTYCVVGKGWTNKVFRLFSLVFCATVVTAVALLPFALQANGAEQLLQIKNRLLPFDRGLVHTYWAPNIWALYCFIDRLLVLGCTGGGSVSSTIAQVRNQVRGVISHVVQCNSEGAAVSTTAGILGAAATFQYLPSISASTCLGVTIITMLPAIRIILSKPSTVNFLDALMYSSLCSFMVGYHVHEKAILIPLILSALSLSTRDTSAFSRALKENIFFLLSISGIHGLLPLFTTAPELAVKFILFLLNCASTMFYIDSTSIASANKLYMRDIQLVIVGANVAIVIFTEFLHPLFFRSSSGEIILPFLPLMLTSVSCAFENAVCWLLALWLMFQRHTVSETVIIHNVGDCDSNVLSEADSSISTKKTN